MFNCHSRFVLAAAVMLLLPAGQLQANLLERWFAPKAELWDYWSDSDEGSSQRIDHSEWDRLVQSYVQRNSDGINTVDYGAVSAADRSVLKAYIDGLEGIAIRRYNRDEQLAFWINLYNATTVDLVLDHYPVEGIRDIDISPGLFAIGPWGKQLLSVEGQALSLNDIEHRILRPIWRDPRLHYVLNCAARGCPNLHHRAYTANNLPALLDGNAAAFVNHPRGVSVEGGVVRLSSIYNWFGDDFGDGDDAILVHIRSYADQALLRSLDEVNRIGGYDYDWSLNDDRAR